MPIDSPTELAVDLPGETPGDLPNADGSSRLRCVQQRFCRCDRRSFKRGLYGGDPLSDVLSFETSDARSDEASFEMSDGRSDEVSFRTSFRLSFPVSFPTSFPMSFRRNLRLPIVDGGRDPSSTSG
jgi:hypothetical protein